MKLVIDHYPWIQENPYAVCYLGDDGKKALAQRFPTEEAARDYCRTRIEGVKRIAEFELPDGT